MIAQEDATQTAEAAVQTPSAKRDMAKPAASAQVTKVVRKAPGKQVTKKPATPTKAVVKSPAEPPANAAAKLPAKAAVKAIVKAPVKDVVKSLAKTQIKPAKPTKEKKSKLVRDSFAIPKGEYTVLDDLKHRAGRLSTQIKKSELLRAGIKALAAMSDSAFLSALKLVPTIKTGRPAKD
jgi:hypothetical protein